MIITGTVRRHRSGERQLLDDTERQRNRLLVEPEAERVGVRDLPDPGPPGERACHDGVGSAGVEHRVAETPLTATGNRISA